ncbi:hypothetical protein GSI_10361 [Ganoderma sinense ZZ0214-1]|uniref:Integrase catalytic domain-containing protein n=1 Tax=Ganoderma sinense ZZ0214-1 TaxID=1077348 RepID=A0A2G8S0E6_9APHY|nr:hypothetical protein GSI_10361 [Ganoderma sinense ZZ0214-1]
MTYVSQPKSAPSASATCDEDLSLWHQCCGYVNFDDLRSVVHKELVNSLTIRSKHLKGKLLTRTPEGYLYWMVFVDDAMRFWAMAYLKRKSNAFAAFKAYKTYAENCLGLRIKATWDDKGGEYMGQEYIDFCAEHSIHRQHTEPDELHQNGVAEGANRMTSEGATALLAQAKLPPSFWGHAVSIFVLRLNIGCDLFTTYRFASLATRPSSNVFGLPLDDVDVPGGPEDTAPPEDGVPDVPELHNQGGDDDYGDPAPPAPPPPHQLSLPPHQPPTSPPPVPPPVPSPSPPPAQPPPAPVAHPPAPSVHQEAPNCTAFRPYPALARKELPACSSHPQGSLNEQVLEHQNLMSQRLCICSASPAPPPPEPERSLSPDPLIEAPVDAPAAPSLR